MFKKIVKTFQNLFGGGNLLDNNFISNSGSDSYVDHGYLGVNNFLWKQEEHYGGFNGLEDTIKTIIGVTENMELTKDSMVLYRGTNSMLFPEIEKAESGMLIPFRGITSTATEFDIAQYFTQNNPRALSEVKPLIFKINIDKNKPHYKIDDDSGEKEVILPPAIYEVVSITDKNGAKVVEINQKELLDMENLILEGLDHINENIEDFNKIKPQHVENLRKRVLNFYNHLEKNNNKTDQKN